MTVIHIDPDRVGKGTWNSILMRLRALWESGIVTTLISGKIWRFNNGNQERQ